MAVGDTPHGDQGPAGRSTRVVSLAMAETRSGSVKTLPSTSHLAQVWSLALVAMLAACDGSIGVDETEEPVGGQSAAAPPSGEGLPSFQDHPATPSFAGEPAEVDLTSHPEAKAFRTALTREIEDGASQARFAGHYRVVVVGCGTTCKSVWVVDLEDGSLHQPFTASVDVAFRPDSRLIVENDPAYYEGLLDEMSAAEVERLMDSYGPPRFWVENEGAFEQIGPRALAIDPRTRKVVAAPAGWRCRNDLEVSCYQGSCEATAGDDFTPMSVRAYATGAMSVCAYSGCWEGTGEIFESDEFRIFAGHDLEFSTSADSPSDRADVVLAIDRSDGVGTLKVGAFAQPLLCESIAGGAR